MADEEEKQWADGGLVIEGVPEGAGVEFEAGEMTFELVPVPGTPFSTLKAIEGSYRKL